MKTHHSALILCFLILLGGSGFVYSFINSPKDPGKGYILEHEKDIAASQPGPHNGGGTTTAYSFFSKADSLKIVFRKRVLHPGSSIGYHLQEADEIFYIVSGNGLMKMNEKTFAVQAGDAILTRPENSHSLTPSGMEDLVVIISYQSK